MRIFSIIVERYADGYVGYPLGLKEVAEGRTKIKQVASSPTLSTGDPIRSQDA